MKNLEYPKNREALADQFINSLNDLIVDDRKAIQDLIQHKVRCSEFLFQHPTMQVGTNVDEGFHTIGMLGIINGLIGVIESGEREGWGFVSAVLNDRGELEKFERTRQ